MIFRVLEAEGHGRCRRTDATPPNAQWEDIPLVHMIIHEPMDDLVSSSVCIRGTAVLVLVPYNALYCFPHHAPACPADSLVGLSPTRVMICDIKGNSYQYMHI